MGIFDLFRKKAPSKKEEPGKEDIYKMIFAKMAEESPSRHFASGVVFDYVRQNRQMLERLLASGNLHGVHMFFVNGYSIYLNDPQALGAIPAMVNRERNDTNSCRWNVSVRELRGGDMLVACYMPIQHESLSARIVGILLGAGGDGYYYCMVNEDENLPSDVLRNKAMQGVETVGSVSGGGFELFERLAACVERDYYCGR